MKNSKGFTLIEILAVIIILGILMIIAIPAVTKYISGSKDTTYITTVNKLIDTAMGEVTGLEYSVSNENFTYYIPTKCLTTENDRNESPYGEFVQSYVVVTYNEGKNDYYYTGVDESGHGILLTYRDHLDESTIKTDLKSIDTSIGIGNRQYNYVYSVNCDKTREKIDAHNNIDERGKKTDVTTEDQPSGDNPSGGGSSSNAVVYPEGKTKDTVVTGDIVTIDTEDFYVVKHDGSDLVLLSRYNLNVGSKKKAGATEGIQDSEVKGYVSGGTAYGTVAFSSTNYWHGKVGTDYPGSYCTSSSGTNCVYVYDANSNLKTYVDSYKTYLEGKGATIKSARLMTLEESYAFSNENQAAWKETSYWLGSAYYTGYVRSVNSDGYFDNDGYNRGSYFGVRPVIII